MSDDDTLWHYTDAAGLLGILGSHATPHPPNVVGPQDCRPGFRATAVEYLNDSRELIHGLGILRDEVLLKRAVELEKVLDLPDVPPAIFDAPGKAKFVRAVCAAIEMIKERTHNRHIHCYVTAFSEKRDALSQWRGYSGGLDGFAIGIDRSKLPNTGEAQIKKVLYSDSLAASSTLADDVNQWLDSWLGGWEAPDSSEQLVEQCVRELSAFAAQFKHDGFKEEAEWRVIHLGFREGASYRNRGAQLIPYTNWSMPAEALVGVRVGPGPNQHENYLAAKGALYGFGYANVEEILTESPTPFR